MGQVPSRFARQRPSAPEGCFPAISESLSRPGNPSGSHLSQVSQRVSRGVLESDAKHRLATGTHRPPGVGCVPVYWWDRDYLLAGYRYGQLVVRGVVKHSPRNFRRSVLSLAEQHLKLAHQRLIYASMMHADHQGNILKDRYPQKIRRVWKPQCLRPDEG